MQTESTAKLRPRNQLNNTVNIFQTQYEKHTWGRQGNYTTIIIMWQWIAIFHNDILTVNDELAFSTEEQQELQRSFSQVK